MAKFNYYPPHIRRNHLVHWQRKMKPYRKLLRWITESLSIEHRDGKWTGTLWNFYNASAVRHQSTSNDPPTSGDRLAIVLRTRLERCIIRLSHHRESVPRESLAPSYFYAPLHGFVISLSRAVLTSEGDTDYSLGRLAASRDSLATLFVIENRRSRGNLLFFRSLTR